jgi:hypothetical protein
MKNALVMVIHGPEVFDGGEAAWLMGVLSPGRVIVAGVMARTAAEESGLSVEFNPQPPSRVISALEGPVFLVNKGKNSQTGEIFGNIVASRLGNRGLVHLECSGRTVYCWDNGNDELAGFLSLKTGYRKKLKKSTLQTDENLREIRGCEPGEAVYVNGIVIGRAVAEVVVLRNRGGRVEPFSGLEPKPHGFEKLAASGPVDITRAWCKSGPIRSAAPHQAGKAPACGRVLVIDHCGHEIYSRMPDDCCGVLAIGDDTTAVCGHILAHRGIPVFGVVDGDRDVIVPPAYAPSSVVAEVAGERDDDVGMEIKKRVPETQVVWDEWVREILDYLHDRASVVVDLRKKS